MRNSIAIIQSTAIDLLQVIVARGELDHLSVDAIEAAVIAKLYFCIQVERLDLQNKLLHIHTPFYLHPPQIWTHRHLVTDTWGPLTAHQKIKHPKKACWESSGRIPLILYCCKP